MYVNMGSSSYTINGNEYSKHLIIYTDDATDFFCDEYTQILPLVLHLHYWIKEVPVTITIGFQVLNTAVWLLLKLRIREAFINRYRTQVNTLAMLLRN